MIRKASIGYWYWHMQRVAFGWRQVGPEWHCVMDDFGTLVGMHDRRTLAQEFTATGAPS